jgi:hypothetical protein
MFIVQTTNRTQCPLRLPPQRGVSAFSFLINKKSNAQYELLMSVCTPSHSLIPDLKDLNDRQNMFNTRLIRLLIRLYRWSAALTTSCTQRLRILLYYSRRFLTKIHGLPRHSTDSMSSATVFTNAFSAWSHQVTPPLPLHNAQITSVTAANSAQDAVSSSAPPSAMPAPCIPQQLAVAPPWTSLHAEVNNTISSSGPGTPVNFTPVGAVNDPRYNKRHLAYVAAALCITIYGLKQSPSRNKCLVPENDGIPAVMRDFPNR